MCVLSYYFLNVKIEKKKGPFSMLITDYLRSDPDLTWDIAAVSGVKNAVIRLPETDDFDITSISQLKDIVGRFNRHGFSPLVLEPLPNELHDHIKLGDLERDKCIEKFIILLKNLNEVGINTVCFNFMAHYGWTRTSHNLPERGGAFVTGFNQPHFSDDGFTLEEGRLWNNYEYFIKAVIPYAEKYNIKLALHPDDPPLKKLGGVARIFTSLDSIERGIGIVNSNNLGVTFCQSCFYLMGEDLEDAIRRLREKIFFIHFRNVKGTKTSFSESFHDNGDIDMASLMKLYIRNNIDVPIRVDHVPTLSFEKSVNAGYDALGRLFAIGYMKGLLEASL